MNTAGGVVPTCRWGDKAEKGEGREQGDQNQNQLAVVVRNSEFDDDKMLLIGALLVISSQNITSQLKQIWEEEKRDKEEELSVKKNRKRDQELRKLQFSITYDRSEDTDGAMGVVGKS